MLENSCVRSLYDDVCTDFIFNRLLLLLYINLIDLKPPERNKPFSGDEIGTNLKSR
ncbi:hypothetical protein Hanom_Chr09g00766581 [Helianthus anomalus]